MKPGPTGGMSIVPWREFLEEDELTREKHSRGLKPQDKKKLIPHDDILPQK